MRRHRRAQRSSRGDGKGLLISRREVGTAPRAVLVAIFCLGSGRASIPTLPPPATRNDCLHFCTFARGSAAVAPLHCLHLISSPLSGQLAHGSTGQLVMDS